MKGDKKHLMSFADGLKEFFTKGSGVKNVRLNSRMREILLEMVNDSLEKTSIMFKKDEQESYEQFMSSMAWVRKQLGEVEHRLRINKKIAWIVTCWLHDNRHCHLAREPEFDKAILWIANKLNVKYSHSEMASSSWKID